MYYEIHFTHSSLLSHLLGVKCNINELKFLLLLFLQTNGKIMDAKKPTIYFFHSHRLSFYSLLLINNLLIYPFIESYKFLMIDVSITLPSLYRINKLNSAKAAWLADA